MVTAIDLPGIEARILRWMVGAGGICVAALVATGRWQMGMAFGVGAGFGVLNFHWLWQTGKVLMSNHAERVPAMTVFLIVARYPLALAALALLYFSGWFPIVPVIAGLLVPSIGVLVESVILIGADLRYKQTA